MVGPAEGIQLPQADIAHAGFLCQLPCGAGRQVFVHVEEAAGQGPAEWRIAPFDQNDLVVDADDDIDRGKRVAVTLHFGAAGGAGETFIHRGNLRLTRGVKLHTY